MSEASPREAAVEIILRWLSAGEFPDWHLERVEVGRAATQEMVLGVVRQRRALDFLLSCMAPREPAPPLRASALVGLYQLFHMDRTEPYAAVNETVEAAKDVAGQGAANFVNAVLRRALREMPALRARLEAQPAPVRLSHPDELWARWSTKFGESKCAALCEWNNSRAETWIRHRPGLDFEKLPRGQAVSDVKGYEAGEFVVQDPATIGAVVLLDVQPGHRTLDLCSAPGGKTIAIVDRMGGRGAVTAVDVHDDRLALLRASLARAQCEQVMVVKGDATTIGFDEPFDRVLLDVPCSNTGVIRRRPDVRWRFSTDRFAQLIGIQRTLLDNASRCVRPGGKLVYSTCSIEPEENEEQVMGWLNNHPEFELSGECRTFPPDSATDGAYAACLVRK